MEYDHARSRRAGEPFAGGQGDAAPGAGHVARLRGFWTFHLRGYDSRRPTTGRICRPFRTGCVLTGLTSDTRPFPERRAKGDGWLSQLRRQRRRA